MLRGETFTKRAGDRMKIAGIWLIVGGIALGLGLGFGLGAAQEDHSYGHTTLLLTIPSGDLETNFNWLLFLLSSFTGLLSGCVLYGAGSLSIDLRDRVKSDYRSASSTPFTPSAQTPEATVGSYEGSIGDLCKECSCVDFRGAGDAEYCATCGHARSLHGECCYRCQTRVGAAEKFCAKCGCPATPGAFSKLAPATETANVKPGIVRLEWSPSEGAERYKLSLRRTWRGSRYVSPVTESIEAQSCEHEIPLSVNESVQWTVAAVRGSRETVADVSAEGSAVGWVLHAEMTIECNVCHASIRSSQTSCEKCGSHQLKCPSCEQPYESDESFCEQCGTRRSDHPQA